MRRLTALFLFSALFLFATLAHASNHCTFVRGSRTSAVSSATMSSLSAGRTSTTVPDQQPAHQLSALLPAGLAQGRQLDGIHRWLPNGPHGLQQRLNTERFDWENTPLEPSVPPPDATPTAKPQIIDDRLGNVFQVIRSSGPVG